MLKYSLVRRVHYKEGMQEVVLFTSEKAEELEIVMHEEIAKWCLKNPSKVFEVVYKSSTDIAFFVDHGVLVVFDTTLKIED